jgi:hypothetical protein
VADDDKEFDDGMGPFDVGLMLLPLLLLLFNDDEPYKKQERAC